MSPSSTLPTIEKLDHYFRQIETIILSRQDPVTGLFPASTEVTAHGDYTDAWVRDNVYAIQSVWGLGLAYRQSGCDNGRAYLLEQTVVKMMRGLLMAMMYQADKVERFKRSRDPRDALHAKYNTRSGLTVVGDDQWGHLQLDATGLYMLMLAQMTKSGLRIVFTIDEVNFVQNLVYYLGRAYRTPDFGMWERGNKINNGRAEINASSLGIVKAALEAMRGLNLFGDDRYENSVVHVIPDDIAQARIRLEALLPRESNSKEVDAALLSVIGYPAFAVEDERLVEKTRRWVLEKLGGRYGCKRFLLDGHQTVLEDTSRMHYEVAELKKFRHIESEWPLFFTYLFIEALFRGDYVEASDYRKKLGKLAIRKDGMSLLPELYYVPRDKVDAEKAQPHSQNRLPNGNTPLIWAQSLYYLGCLIDDGLLSLENIDPLHRHARVGRSKRIEVQIALLAENEDVKRELGSLGYISELAGDLQGITVKEARDLSRVYSYIGLNHKLQLSGRPIRRMRLLATSQVYRIRDELVVFLPQFQNQTAFYMNLDNHLLVEQLAAELGYLSRHWDQPGRPLVVLVVNHSMLNAADRQAFLAFLQEAVTGRINSVNVILGSLSRLVHQTGYESLGEMQDFMFLEAAGLPKAAPEKYLQVSRDALKPVDHGHDAPLQPAEDSESLIGKLVESRNLYEQIEIMQLLTDRHGLEFDTGLGRASGQPVIVKRLLEEVYTAACELRLWAVIRRASGLLDKYYDRLDVAVQEIVIRQKQVTVGRGHNSSVTISEILTSKEIYASIKRFCENDVREVQMNQEVLSLLGLLIKSKPHLFDGIITIRTGHLLLLCVNEYATEMNLEDDKAFEMFSALSPFEIQERLEKILSEYQNAVKELTKLETLHYVKPDSDLTFVNFPESDDPGEPGEVIDWWEWRKQCGVILSLPKQFYQKLWDLLERCPGVVIGDRYNARSRLDAHYVQGAMTRGERTFALLIDGMLNEIYAPEYRYLTVEAIMAIAAFVEVNPDLRFNDYLVLDIIIDHALRQGWLQRHPDGREKAFNEDSALAWEALYRSPPHTVASAVNLALEHILIDSGRSRLQQSVA